MSRLLRAAGLPAVALVLVSTVLAIHLAHGGRTYEPLRPADPCAPRTVTSRSAGIEGLTERLVLIGVDDAACSRGVSREAFTLELAASLDPTAAEIEALRQGLLSAVGEMKADGSLPSGSELVDEALDFADLNGLVEALIRALPDSAVDAALKTDDVLTRVIEDVDLRTLLTNLDDQEDLTRQIEAAVTRAVAESLVDRLRDLV